MVASLIAVLLIFSFDSFAQTRESKKQTRRKPATATKTMATKGLTPQAGTTLDGGAGGSGGVNIPSPAPLPGMVDAKVPVGTDPVPTPPALLPTPTLLLDPNKPLPGVPVNGAGPLQNNVECHWYTQIPQCQQQSAEGRYYIPCPGGNTPCSYRLPGAQAQSSGAGGGAGGGGGMPNLASLFGGGGQGNRPNPYAQNSGGGGFGGGGSGGGSSMGPQSYGPPIVGDPSGLCTETKDEEKRKLCAHIQKQLGDDTCTGRKVARLAYNAQKRASQGLEPIGGINQFCQGFNRNVLGNKVAFNLFLLNLVSALVEKESGWRSGTTGDGGKSKGLLQVSHSDARIAEYSCACSDVATEEGIRDPRKNLRCGTHIVVTNMLKDMEVGRGQVRVGGLNTARGIARYFGPFNDSQKDKRQDMASKTNGWCSSLQGAVIGDLPAASESTGSSPTNN